MREGTYLNVLFEGYKRQQLGGVFGELGEEFRRVHRLNPQAS